MARLHNKTALITGGARGIGAATAKLFVDEGAHVVIGDVLDEAGKALQDALGPTATYLHHDVRNENDWARAIELCRSHGNGLDILVNNAGILIFKELIALSAQEIKDILDINLLGTIIGTQKAGQEMITQGRGGSIINMSSADGLSAANGLAAYVASKWGVRGVTKAAALELGLHNIRVNSIHPGGVDTPMANPFGAEREQFDAGFKIYAAQRGCDPMEVAHAALYFASDEAAYCMGAELAIDGGLTAGHYYFGFPGAPNARIKLGEK